MSQDPVDETDGQPKEDETLEDAAAPAEEEVLASATASGDLRHLERRARLAEDRLTEALTAYRKVKTENEGFRDRVSRDLARQFERRHERVLLKFIDILDNLDRALEAAEQTYAGNPLIEGLILVRTQLLQTLQHEGLERVPALGLPYDPAFGEAVGTEPVEDAEQDHVVVREMLRGYRLHGRVARASRVVVGVYREGAAAAPLTTEDLIGADEPRLEAKTTDATAADTIPLDEGAIAEIFGTGDRAKKDEPAKKGEPE